MIIHAKDYYYNYYYLPRGIFDSILFALTGSDHPTLAISVIMTVGLTQFTRIPWGPSSSAIARVRASRAAFDAP